MLPKVLPISKQNILKTKGSPCSAPNLSYNVRKHIPAWKMQIPIEHGEPTRRAEGAVYPTRSGTSAAMSSYPNGKLQPREIPAKSHCPDYLSRLLIQTLSRNCFRRAARCEYPIAARVAFQASALLRSQRALRSPSLTRQNSKQPRYWHNFLPRMDLMQQICD